MAAAVAPEPVVVMVIKVNPAVLEVPEHLLVY
jgi:hypothetical protein